ncbi:GNAT family N-acetyltransferase [Bacillus sp. BGMRC 2118]|nr:GNAT family N-acetyltransferase [Bacillus sp. BGMRC 2118]
MMTSRKYENDDYTFILQCVRESNDWQEEECNISEIDHYLKEYEHVNGEWLVWCEEDKEIGISYSVDQAQSNGRPWLGTILVHPAYQRSGYGKSVISQLVKRWSAKGEKVAYAAVPIMRQEWISFLSACGFEQYKIEKEGDKTYLLCIIPL